MNHDQGKFRNEAESRLTQDMGYCRKHKISDYKWDATSRTRFF